MRYKNNAGKEGLRVEVFMPDLNPGDARRAAKFIGTAHDLSLIIRTPGIHHKPGQRIETRATCYELYIHDEVTRGGVLVADSCQLPEYYLDQVVTDVDTEIITLTMNDGWEFTIDLKPILAKYDTMIRRNEDGTLTFIKNSIDIISWMEGAVYEIDNTDSENPKLVINAATGISYAVPLTIWDFTADETDGTLTIWKDGQEYLTLLVGGGGGPITPSYETSITFVEETAEEPAHYIAQHEDPELDDVKWYPVSYMNTDDGMLVTVTNSAGESSSFLVQAATVVLLNPTIYIRQATGTANPTITKQTDLTEANAFNNFINMKNWLKNTLVIGSITIDARGTFTNQGDIGSGSMQNAADINIIGDPADPSLLTLNAHKNATTKTVGSALQVTSGGTVTIGDCTLNSPAVSDTVAGIYSPLQVTNGTLKTSGTVRFTGEANIGAADVKCAIVGIYSSTSLGVLQLTYTKFEFAYSAGHDLHRIFLAREGGSMLIGGGLEFTFTTDLSCDALFSALVGCRIVGQILPGAPPVFTSGMTGEIVNNCVFELQNFAVYTYNGWLPMDAATWPLAGALANLIDDYAVVNNVLGSNL